MDIARIWQKTEQGWEIFESYDMMTEKGKAGLFAAVEWIESICKRKYQITYHSM